MTVQPGTRIGAYQVVAEIGAGGMGHVYRAHDPRLGRDVAIKILPPALSADPEYLARFEREARTLAALNHRNIAQIYGVEDHGGVRALVMELVEGPTLDAWIANAASRALEDPRYHGVAAELAIAQQIADALDAAHEQGIVHRDLKPANVKVRDDGTVKVLDFGLAKPFGAAPASGDPTNSPTITSPATALGMILGTAAYMSPEQARGRAVDKRADVWAFGVVLFEMLTRQRLFQGETVSDTLAAVLRQDVPWSALPSGTPRPIRRLLERCLDRDPRRRLRDIGDAKLDIDDALAGRAEAPASPPAMPARTPSPWRERVAWTIVALAIVAAAAVWWAGRGRSIAASQWHQFTQLTDQAGEEIAPALSPDGTQIAYASRARGTLDIYVLRVGGRNAVLVAGDPNRHESWPAFSPDGRSIAFHESDRDGGIFVVGATGESVRRLTDLGFHPAWSPAGQIAFCTEEILSPYGRNSTSSLWVVDSAGGPPRKLYDGDAVMPEWSPSGARIAFWAAYAGQRDLFTIPAAGGEAVPVIRDAPLDWNAAWSPDGRFLYFASDRGGPMNIWRIGIDEQTGLAQGAPEPVTAGVQAMASTPRLSRSGEQLVFESSVASVNPAAIPLDPVAEQAGVPRILFERSGIFLPTDVSPDGAWLAVTNTGERKEDIFVAKADGTDLRRVTDDAARDMQPVWSPDSAELAFYSNRNGRYGLWTVRSDGSSLKLAADPPKDIELIYPLYGPRGDRMIGTLMVGVMARVFEFTPGQPWQQSKVIELPGTRQDDAAFAPIDWSPDGKRLAGPLVNTAGFTVGVAWYDLDGQALHQIGNEPMLWGLKWMPDSRRLVYISGDEQILLVDTDSGRTRVLAERLPFRLAFDALALSPDARTIYVGAARFESDIWLAERK